MNNENNLSQFYNDLKQKLHNDEPNVDKSALINVVPIHGASAYRAKAQKCCKELKNDCYKHLLLDIYCKVLPLDPDFIHGHMGDIKSDIDNMLNYKQMTPEMYFKSCYESTKAPLLDFIIRSVDGIGRSYLEDTETDIKNAQAANMPLPEPTNPTSDDKSIESQLVDVSSDMEYETFIDKLKQKTINKIVDDVSKIIEDKKEENDMTFNTTNNSISESAVAIALDYIQYKLVKESVDPTNIDINAIGYAIRESTLIEINKVFKQPGTSNQEFKSRIGLGNGYVINENVITNMINAYKLEK